MLFLKSFFLFFLFFFFAAYVNPRLVRSEPNQTNRNRFCSVPRFTKNRSVSIYREPNLCHKLKNRTKTDRLNERPGRVLTTGQCVAARIACRLAGRSPAGAIPPYHHCTFGRWQQMKNRHSHVSVPFFLSYFAVLRFIFFLIKGS